MAGRVRTTNHDVPGAGGGPTWPLSAKQLRVLRAVADGRIRRDVLCGSLEPHLLEGREVIWTLRALVIRGLIHLNPIGPPVVTRRGRAVIDRARIPDRPGLIRRDPDFPQRVLVQGSHPVVGR